MQVRDISLCLYLTINSLFLLKYVGRSNQSLAALAVLVYILILAMVFFWRKKHGRFFSLSWRKLCVVMAVLLVLLAVMQYAIDPYSLRVDRWSAIHNFIEHLFQGIYPYSAQTHLGGYGSPFPVWQLVHVPFYLLGNIGLSVFPAMALFVYAVAHTCCVRNACMALLFLLVSPGFLYEVTVRSDLMTNFLLVCAILLLLRRQGVSLSARWFGMAMLCGLLMSSRLSAVIPFVICYFKDYLQASWRVKVLFPIVMLSVFAATFLPFMMWDGEMQLFFEYNPFVLQTRQGHLSDFLLFIPVGIWLSMSWRGNTFRLMGHTAVMLVLLVLVTFVHNMYVDGNWDQLFESTYDISYFNMSMPFIIVSMLPLQKTHEDDGARQQLWHPAQTNGLRGVAALIIVVFHLLIAWEFPRIVNLPGSVAVAMFLFLSGFGIHESYKRNGLTHFWRKKFRRIILPYALFITVQIPFQTDFDIKTYLLDICFIDSSYWFIAYLIRCYLLYWVIQRFCPSKLLWLYFVGGIVGLNVFPQMEAEQSFSFFLGICASGYIDRLRSASSKNLLKIAACGFLLGLFFLLLKEIPAVHAYRGTLLYNYILLMIKMPLAIPLLLLPVWFPFLSRSRFLYLCGISSLEIYLVHLALMDFAELDMVMLTIYIFATILLTFLFYQLNQRIVGVKFGRH